MNFGRLSGRPVGFAGSSSAASTPLWRKLVPAALLWCAFFPIAQPFAFAVGWRGLQNGYWIYNAGFAALSWFNTGFARRELEGTIIRLFTSDPMVGVGWFHLMVCSALAVLGVYGCCRPYRSLGRQLLLGVTLVAILVRLGTDVGRPDSAVMVCGLLAAWAAREARWAVSASAVSIALLFHEAGLIVLAPLVVFVVWTTGSWRRWRTRSAAVGGTILCAAVIAYVVAFNARVDLHAIANQVHRHFPVHPEQADYAVSFNLAGIRGLKAAICMNGIDPLYPLRIVCGLGLCCLFSFGLQPKRWRTALLMTVPSLIFLSIVATDVGRWTVFSAFNIFAFSAIVPEPAAGVRAPQIGAVLVGALLMSSFLIISDTAPVIPLADAAAARLGIKSPNGIAAYTACDPGWRSAIGLLP